MRHLVLLALLLAPLSVRAASVSLVCPTKLTAGSPTPIKVLVNTGGPVLGAYSVTVTTDSSLTLGAVSGGATVGYQSAPTVNKPSAGSATLAAYQTNTSAPTGAVSVATITVQAPMTAKGSSTIGLTVNHLFGPSGTEITPVTGTGCTVQVKHP